MRFVLETAAILGEPKHSELIAFISQSSQDCITIIVYEICGSRSEREDGEQMKKMKRMEDKGRKSNEEKEHTNV